MKCAEVSFWIANLLKEILLENSEKHPLPVIEYTDSRQLYDAIESICPTPDNGLRINTPLLNEMNCKKEIKVEWIHNAQQITNSLMNPGASS